MSKGCTGARCANETKQEPSKFPCEFNLGWKWQNTWVPLRVYVWHESSDPDSGSVIRWRELWIKSRVPSQETSEVSDNATHKWVHLHQRRHCYVRKSEKFPEPARTLDLLQSHHSVCFLQNARLAWSIPIASWVAYYRPFPHLSIEELLSKRGEVRRPKSHGGVREPGVRTLHPMSFPAHIRPEYQLNSEPTTSLIVFTLFTLLITLFWAFHREFKDFISQIITVAF